MKLVTRKLKSLKPCPWNPRETLQPGEHEYEAIKEGDTLEVEKTFSQDDMLKILQESNRRKLRLRIRFTMGKRRQSN